MNKTFVMGALATAGAVLLIPGVAQAIGRAGQPVARAAMRTGSTAYAEFSKAGAEAYEHFEEIAAELREDLKSVRRDAANTTVQDSPKD